MLDGLAVGLVHGTLMTLRQSQDKVEFGVQSEAEIPVKKELLKAYFQLNVDLNSLQNQWNKDANFKAKSSQFHGLRVLDQDPIENVFSFICSSNNNISRITKLVNALCTNYGVLVGTVQGSEELDVYSFPDVCQLTGPNVESQLRDLGFGYRAKFIVQTAKILEQNGLHWLHGLRHLDYPTAKSELLTLSGVGPKVADCICLMSLNKTMAIPVDTHVWQIATLDYGLGKLTTKSLTDKSYKLIGDTFYSVFGEYCGWAQTILFAADLKVNQSPPSKPSKRRKKE